MNTWIMVKTGLIKQVRSYRFLVVLAIAIGVAYFCVPTSRDNYNVFVIGGMRGVYNSAYLGVLASAGSAVILFLAGFYLLRSQITEDRELKIGQIIASKSISKQRYVFSKVISNFLVLILMESVFLISIMVIQFIRGEDMYFSLMGYIWPLLEITLPFLLVLASLTVLFDTIPFLRGIIGNIVFFTLWNILVILSYEYTHRPMLDLLGISRITTAITQGAVSANPDIDANKFLNDVNFGLNIGTNELPAFVWNGLEIIPSFVVTRIIWIGIAVGIILLSSLAFDRFRKNAAADTSSRIKQRGENKTADKTFNLTLPLSPITGARSKNLWLLVKSELRVMRSELSYGQIGLLAIGIALHVILPSGSMMKWLSLFLMLLTNVWAGMSCRDNQYRTQAMVYSRCDMRDKWIAAGLAGLIIAFTVSSGAILRFALSGAWLQAVSWVVGMYFVVSLAMTLGTLTGSRRLFEALFIIWLYLGPVQEVPALNFLSNEAVTVVLYGLMGVILTGMGFFMVTLKEKRVSNRNNR